MKIADLLRGDGSSTMQPRWDGKIILAAMFILGYYVLVLVMAWRPLPTSNAQLMHDAMLVLGPGIGVILGALYRTTGADERQAQLRSSDLQTAITTPTTVDAAPAPTPGYSYTNGASTASLRPAVEPATVTDRGAPTNVYDGPPPADVPPASTDVPEEPSWPS